LQDVRIGPQANAGRRADQRRTAFERFVDESSEALLRTAYLIASDVAEAEDLVQECLMVVARRWPRVHRMDHPHAYARRVLVNLALDGSARRSRRRSELGIEDTSAIDRVPDAASDRALRTVDVRAELLQALATLPPRQRAVLVLRYFEDLPEAQVAELLGCSVGTVKSTASRGLARLQDALPTSAKEHT
jgi:RNA polymerase sigma-70 factor (sigma-E family)